MINTTHQETFSDHVLGTTQDKDIYRKPIHFNREIALTVLGLLVTGLATVFSVTDIVKVMHASHGHISKIVEQIVFMVLVLALVYGNFLYQLTRIGYFLRLKKHRPADWKSLDRFFAGQAPSLTILLPSYKEELRVIRQSILSTALQEYPNKRVVLLIDDPTHPKNPADLDNLTAARELPNQIMDLLYNQHARMEQFYADYLRRKQHAGFIRIFEASYLRKIYLQVADWYRDMAVSTEVLDHTDELFVAKVFLEPARHYDAKAMELDRLLDQEIGGWEEKDFDLAFRKLTALFKVEITAFERKKYENLSHESNKAMNLNSYISLLGQDWVEVKRRGKWYLEQGDAAAASLRVPAADYLITLDADSLLSFDYAIRLIAIMEEPGNERLAVAQTPYSAVPDPSSLLERVSGATTDMQYLIHQGFTYHNATYWVGANALLRVKALADIHETVMERGHKVSIFIQDRTVIEDTESSIDLVVKGWHLFNYPQRLSYSATPPDFGALLIQRRRWANGGLIIFPKLARYLGRDFNFLKKFHEGFMRTHYLISILAVNLALPILFLHSFDNNLGNPWLPLTALPYYFFYGRDLIQAGYALKDLFRVYALNLLLVPVNLGGVFKSIEQGISKKKIPFKRTPKVMGRTAAPAAYIVLEFLILANFAAGVIVDCAGHRYYQAAFGLINGLFFLYAIDRFIGFKEAWEDIQVGIYACFSKKTAENSLCLCLECQTNRGAVPAQGLPSVLVAS